MQSSERGWPVEILFYSVLIFFWKRTETECPWLDIIDPSEKGIERLRYNLCDNCNDDDTNLTQYNISYKRLLMEKLRKDINEQEKGHTLKRGKFHRLVLYSHRLRRIIPGHKSALFRKGSPKDLWQLGILKLVGSSRDRCKVGSLFGIGLTSSMQSQRYLHHLDAPELWFQGLHNSSERSLCQLVLSSVTAQGFIWNLESYKSNRYISYDDSCGLKVLRPWKAKKEMLTLVQGWV